jgi:type IV fimbrial biogenesis protein FimT
MKSRANTRASAGISLVEVMVVVAVTGILLGLAAPSFADMLNRRRVQMVAEALSSDLAYARAEAGLAHNNNVNMQFAQPADMSCYTVYIASALGDCLCSRPPGAACTSIKVELKTVQVPSSMGVSISVAGQQDWVTFEALRMTNAANSFAVTVEGVRGSKLQVQVNAMGRIKTCVPAGGNFNGVPACD